MIALLTLIALASQLKIVSLIRSSKMKSTLIFEMKIEDLLEDIIRKTCVDRALLCKLHNGGGRITIGAQKKISVVCEPGASLQPHTKETYQSVPVDRAYRDVMIDMLEARGVFTFQNILQEPFGMLRRKTEADGLTATLHYFVKETNTGAYFVFLATKDDPNELLGRPEQSNLIEEKVQQIRNACNKAHRRKLLK